MLPTVDEEYAARLLMFVSGFLLMMSLVMCGFTFQGYRNYETLSNTPWPLDGQVGLLLAQTRYWMVATIAYAVETTLVFGGAMLCLALVWRERPDYEEV